MRSNLAGSAAEPAVARSAPGHSRPARPIGQHSQRLRLVTATPSRGAREDAERAPSSCFFICHTLRCGSTLLSDALSSTGVAGYPEEYLPERTPDGRVSVATVAALKDPETWQSDWTRTPFDECLERVRISGTSANGVFASKLKWSNLPYLAETLGTRHERPGVTLAGQLDRLFPNLRYVWITRRDKVRQAVSLVKARQSAQWTAMSASVPQPGRLDYSFHVIDTALRRIVQEECAWGEFFTQAGITPITVVYEDLIRDYESSVRRLLEDLQISLPNDYAFPPPRVHKQADGVSEEWVGRYKRDARQSRTMRTVASLPELLVKRRLRETYVLPRVRRRIERVTRSRVSW